MSWLFWLLLGFAIEWAIELWYWRGRRAAQFTAPLEARIRELEDELRRASVVGVAGRGAAPATSSRPTAAPARAPAEPAAEAAPALTSRRAKRRDDLKAIRGIGEVFQDKLFDAGVTTYDALAAMSAEDVAAIIQAEDWQNYDYGDWIRQAAELARKV